MLQLLLQAGREQLEEVRRVLWLNAWGVRLR